MSQECGRCSCVSFVKPSLRPTRRWSVYGDLTAVLVQCHDPNSPLLFKVSLAYVAPHRKRLVCAFVVLPALNAECPIVEQVEPRRVRLSTFWPCLVCVVKGKFLLPLFNAFVAILDKTRDCDCTIETRLELLCFHCHSLVSMFRVELAVQSVLTGSFGFRESRNQFPVLRPFQADRLHPTVG